VIRPERLGQQQPELFDLLPSGEQIAFAAVGEKGECFRPRTLLLPSDWDTPTPKTK